LRFGIISTPFDSKNPLGIPFLPFFFLCSLLLLSCGRIGLTDSADVTTSIPRTSELVRFCRPLPSIHFAALLNIFLQLLAPFFFYTVPFTQTCYCSPISMRLEASRIVITLLLPRSFVFGLPLYVLCFLSNSPFPPPIARLHPRQLSLYNQWPRDYSSVRLFFFRLSLSLHPPPVQHLFFIPSSHTHHFFCIPSFGLLSVFFKGMGPLATFKPLNVLFLSTAVISVNVFYFSLL